MSLYNIEKKQIMIQDEIFNPSNDLISLIDPDDNKNEDENYNDVESLPILPLRNTVLFPDVVLPITVGRTKSLKLVKEIYEGNKKIGVVSQTDETEGDPTFKDLNKFGTYAKIMKTIMLPDGNITIIILGKKKIELTPDLNVDGILEEMANRYSNEEITTLDGVKIDFENNWVHLRKSNTEPIIRIYTEATSQKEADDLADSFIQEIRSIT